VRIQDAGVIWTTPNTCSPLDEIEIILEYTKLSNQKVTFEIQDAVHQPYFQTTVTAKPGQASIRIKPGKKLGTHYIIAKVHTSETQTYNRWGSFRVQADTRIQSDNKSVDDLLKLLGDGLKLSFDIVQVDGKPITYHKCADNTTNNLCYPAFYVPAVRYFLDDLKPMLDVLFDHQWPSGKLPDHIYSDENPGWENKSRIRSMMADLETGAVSTVYKSWVAHGDNEWVKKLLPKMEAGLEFLTTDPQMFDTKIGLIKRPHTMDEWDYQLGDNSCFINENSKFVVMQGDTSSMFEACTLMAEMYEATGNPKRASYWRHQRKYYYEKGNQVFWDGTKYRHHVHIDSLDHGDFNEDEQLTMSNTWAITRGFADHQKAVAILNEYLRRWKKSGDRFPWWTLDPGYPTEKLFPQNVYANGGLFPWVGGELCRAAFEHGMEDLGYTLLLDFYSVIKRDHGAVFTWYDRQGNPGLTSLDQTNYDSWGMQPWTQAVIEGLAGVRSEGKLFETVTCCPRWPAAKTSNATTIAHFPASDAYFAYHYQATDKQIEIEYTGTGKKVHFRVLLPAWKDSITVTLDGQPISFERETIENSSYAIVSSDIHGTRKLTVSR